MGFNKQASTKWVKCITFNSYINFAAALYQNMMLNLSSIYFNLFTLLFHFIPSDGEKFELAVIHPTAVLGPVLHNQMGTSMEIMKRILEKNPPMIPKLNIPAVDVRDVAKAHVVAMTEPEAAGL